MADIILKNKVYKNIDTVFLPSKGGNMVRFSEGFGGDAMPTPSFTLEEGTPDADGLSRSGLVRTTGLSYMEGRIDAGGIAGLVSTMLDMFGGSGGESDLTELSENAPKLINNTVITKLKDVLKECAAIGIHYPKYTVHIRLTVDALQSLCDALPIAGLDAHNLDKQVEAIGKLWGYEKVTDLQPMIDDIQSALDDPETSEEDKKDMTAQKNFYEWLIDTVDSLIAAAKELLADDGVEVINVLLPEFQTSWAGLVNTVLPIVVKEMTVITGESTNGGLDIIGPIAKDAVHALLGGLGGTFEPALFAYQVLGELNAVGLLKLLFSSSTADMVTAIVNTIFYTKGMEIQVMATAGGLGKVPSAQSIPMTISRSMLVYDEKETLCEAKTVTLKAGGKTLNCSEGVSKVGDGVMFRLPEVVKSEGISGFVYPEENTLETGTLRVGDTTSTMTQFGNILAYRDDVRYITVTALSTGTYAFEISGSDTRIRLYVCDDSGNLLAYSPETKFCRVYLIGGKTYTVRWQMITNGNVTSCDGYLYYQYESASGSASSEVPNDMALKLNATIGDSVTLSSQYTICGNTPSFTMAAAENGMTVSCDTTLPVKWPGYGLQVEIVSNGKTYTGKFALDDMTSGSIKLFDRSFTQEELSAATITAVFGHGIKADHILALSHFYRLGDFSMKYPEVIGEEVPGTFDLEHRLVMLSADKNGMFRAFEQAIEKAPTPVIQLHMGATNEILTLKNDQSGYTDIIISDGAVMRGNFADLSSVPGGKHSVQQRLYGDNIALSDASNAVEVTTAAITSLSANWTLTGNVKTAVAPVAITDDDEQPGEHRVVMNDDRTCTIVEPTAACQCKFAKKAESTSESGSTTDSSVSTTATTEPGNQEDAETVVYPDAGSVLVLRGSYSFVDFLNPNKDGSGMPSGDLYENYTYDAATGTFTFPDLCEDVYIFVKGE